MKAVFLCLRPERNSEFRVSRRQENIGRGLERFLPERLRLFVYREIVVDVVRVSNIINRKNVNLLN